MAQFRPRLLSAPHKVYFAGFESTTFKLQNHGWQLSANEDYYGQRAQLAMRYEPAGLYMIADSVEHTYGHYYTERPLEFVISKVVGRDIIISSYDISFESFKPIDATPRMVERKESSISDFNIFATPLVRTEEIIIDPKSVSECLELIRKMQAPDLEQIRERNRAREVMADQKFHAQILSVA